MAELLVGRRGGGSPLTNGGSRQRVSGDRWRVVGGLGVVTAYTIAITYAVVVGWVLVSRQSVFPIHRLRCDDRRAFGITPIMRLWLDQIGNFIVGGIIYAGVTAGIERVSHHDADVLTAGRPEYLQLLCGRFRRDT